MKISIKKSVISGSTSFLWFLRVSGKVDVFCYERGGIDQPKQSDYPAYNQAEYRLATQDKWNQVSVNEINSENLLFNTKGSAQGIRDGENYCNTGDKQSPITLQADNKCEDEHRARGRAIAKCAWSDIYFTIDSNSLRADFVGCKSMPMIDFSHSPAYYDLEYMHVKVPSEHCTYHDGKKECYDGEIAFVHRGTKSDKADLRDEMMNVAGLIKATDTPNEYFEMVLTKWEHYQQLQYERCGLNYVTGWATNNVTWGESLCDTKNKIEKARRWQAKRHLRLRENGSTQHLVGDSGISEVVPPVRWYDDAGDDHDQKGSEKMLEEINSKEAVRRRDLFNEDLKMYYKLLPRGPFYYRYTGSMTTPPCSEKVNWRVFTEPYIISYAQLHRTEYLIAAHVNEQCNIASVGRPRKGSCKVDVNRELQPLSHENELAYCNQWNGAKWGNP